jgi:hypothetical protein
MSASDAGKAGGFNPVPPPRKPRLNVDQFREFANLFKELVSENPLVKWSIVCAGLGGVFEAVHDTWLFFVWLYWMVKK